LEIIASYLACFKLIHSYFIDSSCVLLFISCDMWN
jgi:hypothetical protein